MPAPIRTATEGVHQPSGSPTILARRHLPQRIDRSLARHSFLYAGEWQNGSFAHQRMFLVSGGQIIWSYELPFDGEFGQVTMLPNRHVLFARHGGASEIDPTGTVVWNFDSPAGTEIHTCRPVGTDQIFLVVNAEPAKALLLNRADNTVLAALTVPTRSSHPHGMFRHCSYTAAGTILIAHLDSDLVTEYDWTGNVLWSVPSHKPWAAVRLNNGNTLVSGDTAGYVNEYTPTGAIAWCYTREDAAAVGIELFCVQQATRLANGNTIIANWCSEHEPEAIRRQSIQLLEVSPGKDLLWALSEWNNPDLGPASSFDILDADTLDSNPDPAQRERIATNRQTSA